MDANGTPDAQQLISDLEAKLDVSTEALRKAEERAIAGQLALELMHEIRNPLEALGHLTYLAAEEAKDPKLVGQYMRLAEEQIQTLNQIARQTLGFARESAMPKRMDLVALAEAALRIHQRTIASKGVLLVKHLDPEVVAEGHMGEILQALSNLIVNALDALPEKGTLCLRLRKRNGSVHLLVADNGHGIPAEHREHIFKPFFTTKEDRGNGLGLALSKRIVERHRGRIALRSCVHPGRSGTTFRISLPA